MNLGVIGIPNSRFSNIALSCFKFFIMEKREKLDQLVSALEATNERIQELSTTPSPNDLELRQLEFQRYRQRAGIVHLLNLLTDRELRVTRLVHLIEITNESRDLKLAAGRDDPNWSRLREQFDKELLDILSDELGIRIPVAV